MKIVEILTKPEDYVVINVADANYIGDYAIWLKFNDDSERLIDFKPFLAKSHHPSIRKYLNEDKFRQFEIVDGNINWNDYDLIFPVADLYDGKII